MMTVIMIGVIIIIIMIGDTSITAAVIRTDRDRQVTTLLEASLFPGLAVDRAWDKRSEDLTRADRSNFSFKPMATLRMKFSASSVTIIIN